MMSQSPQQRKAPLSPEEALRSIRGARRGLAAVVLVTILGTVVFAGLWQRKVEELLLVTPEQYATQGAGSARYFKGRLEEALTELMERRQGLGPRPGEELPLLFQQQLQQLASDQPTTLPAILTLLHRNEESGRYEPVARLIGRGQVPDPPAAEFRPDGALRVAVVERESDWAVVVHGPIRVGKLDGDPFQFRCVSVYHSFGEVAAVGVRYSLILLISYLLLLYGVLFLGLRLRRRMTETVLATREKEVRLKAMGSVAEGIAHEVRNPLNATSLMVQYMERLAQKTDQVAAPEDYERIYIELGRIRKIIDNFVGFAKLRDMEVTQGSLGDIAAEALEACAEKLEKAGAQASLTVDGDVSIEGDAPKMTRVCRSLIENAIEEVQGQDDGRIVIEVAGSKKSVSLIVSDNGSGATAEVLESMFEPYYSTRSRSTGLGLTLARTVVESHGGTISVQDRAGGGCSFTVLLPRTF
jgi:signal transduction histidine kinase